MTPAKIFESIDPSASVIFKNCVVSIVENELAPPPLELTAAESEEFTDDIREAELLEAMVDENTKTTL